MSHVTKDKLIDIFSKNKEDPEAALQAVVKLVFMTAKNMIFIDDKGDLYDNRLLTTARGNDVYEYFKVNEADVETRLFEIAGVAAEVMKIAMSNEKPTMFDMPNYSDLYIRPDIVE